MSFFVIFLPIVTICVLSHPQNVYLSLVMSNFLSQLFHLAWYLLLRPKLIRLVIFFGFHHPHLLLAKHPHRRQLQRFLVQILHRLKRQPWYHRMPLPLRFLRFLLMTLLQVTLINSISGWLRKDFIRGPVLIILRPLVQ